MKDKNTLRRKKNRDFTNSQSFFSLKSDAVKMEWQAALKINKKIIPVFRREQDIPTLLSTKLGIQFNESDLEGTNKSIYDLILKKLEI